MLPESAVTLFLSRDVLTIAEVSELSGFSRKILADLRRRRAGPPFRMLRGGRVGYNGTMFAEYLRRQIRGAGEAGKKARR